MEDFVKKLPKIELHAHLNGSLSDETLSKLVDLRRKKDPNYKNPSIINFTKFRSLSECFDVFKIAHELVDSIEAVKLAAKCVFQQFADDNVVYLEIRSTPRASATMTKSEYLQAVVDAILLCREEIPNIIVKFIPSINVSYGIEEATENFKLFSEMRKKYPDIICAIDLSGDPTKGEFANVKHLYERARNEGFRIALHCAEVENYPEILEKLKFMTSEDRIGHGTFINESDKEIWKIFTEKNIPVEICLTSNVLCKSVPSYEEHHFLRLLQLNHPIMICTDDFGVFKTCLSNEMKICADTFKLRKIDVINLTKTANKYSFASDLERQLIGEKIETFERLMLNDE